MQLRLAPVVVAGVAHVVGGVDPTVAPALDAVRVANQATAAGAVGKAPVVGVAGHPGGAARCLGVVQILQ